VKEYLESLIPRKGEYKGERDGRKVRSKVSMKRAFVSRREGVWINASVEIRNTHNGISFYCDSGADSKRLQGGDFVRTLRYVRREGKEDLTS